MTEPPPPARPGDEGRAASAPQHAAPHDWAPQNPVEDSVEVDASLADPNALVDPDALGAIDADQEADVPELVGIAGFVDVVEVVEYIDDGLVPLPERAAPEPELPRAGEILIGAAATGVTTTFAVARRARRMSRPVTRTLLRPPVVPTRWQPATWLAVGAKLGATQRERARTELEHLLDAVVPMVVDQIVSRIDFTALLEQQIDMDVIIQRIDLVGLAEQVLDGIDLPEIIRESTGSVASETVRGARMQGIAADEAISRAVDRLLFRRNKPAS